MPSSAPVGITKETGFINCSSLESPLRPRELKQVLKKSIEVVTDTESYLDLQESYREYNFVTELEIRTVRVLSRPYNQGTYGRCAAPNPSPHARESARLAGGVAPVPANPGSSAGGWAAAGCAAASHQEELPRCCRRSCAPFMALRPLTV